jgi:hypothetical protein
MAISTIFKADENGCKKQLIKYADKIIGKRYRVMGRGRPAAGMKKELPAKKISTQDKRNLQVLADDFGLLHRKDVQDIIQNSRSYSEGQQKILRIYAATYL